MKLNFSRLSEISSLSELTAGEMLFFGGFALAAVTVLLALIFLIFRPKYKPESATYVVKKGIKSKKAEKMRKNTRSGDTTIENISKTEIVANDETEIIKEDYTERPQQIGPGETELVGTTQDSKKTDIL